MLNIGPTAEGVFPPPSIERLEGIGKWMKVNGEAIYGTQASPFPALEWGRCTQKAIDGGTRLYLHVFDWPRDGRLIVPGIASKPDRAYLLADARKARLSASRDAGGILIQLPADRPDPVDSVVVLEIKGKPADRP